jgi:hypothetical protein
MNELQADSTAPDGFTENEYASSKRERNELSEGSVGWHT